MYFLCMDERKDKSLPHSSFTLFHEACILLYLPTYMILVQAKRKQKTGRATKGTPRITDHI